jgi:hypothetical protein
VAAFEWSVGFRRTPIVVAAMTTHKDAIQLVTFDTVLPPRHAVTLLDLVIVATVYLATYLRVSTLAYTANLLVVVPLSNVTRRLALYHRVDTTGMFVHVGILVLIQRRHDGA